MNNHFHIFIFKNATQQIFDFASMMNVVDAQNGTTHNLNFH
jgi:hypothetical protein